MKGLTGKGKERCFGKYKEKTNNVWQHQHVRCKCHQEKCFGELPFSTYCTVVLRLRSTQHFRTAVIQTAATAAPKTHFLRRRCWNGRKVAWVRSKEIAARFITEAIGKTKRIPIKMLGQTPFGGGSIFQSPQENPDKDTCMVKEIPPTHMSATARLITKCMVRLRILCSIR